MHRPRTCRYCQQPIADHHAAQRRYCSAACKQAAYRVRQNQQQRRQAPWATIDWIATHFPTHHTYVEPWCTHCAMLLRKQPARAVILNDWQGHIRVLQHVVETEEDHLVELLAATMAFPPMATPAAMHPNHPLAIARQVVLQSWAGTAPLYARRTARRRTAAAGPTREALVRGHLATLMFAIADACILSMEPATLIQQTAQPGALLHGELPALPYGGLSAAAARQSDPIRSCLWLIEEHGATAILSGKRNPTDEALFGGWSQQVRQLPADLRLSEADVVWISPGAEVLKARAVGASERGV